jgi:hypothetical protein
MSKFYLQDRETHQDIETGPSTTLHFNGYIKGIIDLWSKSNPAFSAVSISVSIGHDWTMDSVATLDAIVERMSTKEFAEKIEDAIFGED